MDAKTFLETHGKEVAERVAIRAETNWAYFTQIVAGTRRPSPDLARKLVEASAEEVATLPEQLDFEALLPSKRAVA